MAIHKLIKCVDHYACECGMLFQNPGAKTRARQHVADNKRYAFCVSDKVPTCEDGAECDAAENPSHHVEIKTEEWILKALRAALKELAGNRDVTYRMVMGNRPTFVETELRDALDALKEAR